MSTKKFQYLICCVVLNFPFLTSLYNSWVFTWLLAMRKSKRKPMQYTRTTAVEISWGKIDSSENYKAQTFKLYFSNLEKNWHRLETIPILECEKITIFILKVLEFIFIDHLLSMVRHLWSSRSYRSDWDENGPIRRNSCNNWTSSWKGL